MGEMKRGRGLTIDHPASVPRLEKTSEETIQWEQKEIQPKPERSSGSAAQRVCRLSYIDGSTKIVMDVIKKEPEVDPLAIQWSDNTDTDGKKSLSEEELCDLDTVKDELELEVTAEENVIFTSSVDIVDKTESSACDSNAHKEEELEQHCSYGFDTSIDAYKIEFKLCIGTNAKPQYILS
ncbi:hypothetical protein ANN_27880 [Periplaneta americana]|uniref:Uncharacterized protein n=1 Tax=Periplaneta americana TaxID=6978 RepID=A0ABQ8RVD0_PERAM|nr:hypothetical protein ANN_27880 [Periplaneta americana]